MKTPAQKEANRLNAAKRRREQPHRVAAIRRRVWERGGREREHARRQRQKRENFFGYHAQFARRYNAAITAADLESLWKSQGGRCGLTGRSIEPVAGQVHLDHIVPRRRGGSNDLANLRWVCAVANNAKRDQTDEEFLALCRDVGEWLGRRLLARGLEP